MQIEQKLLERIKAVLGDVISEEDLKPLVVRAIEEGFFKQRVTKDRWDRIIETKPSYVVEFIQKEMQDVVRSMVREWLSENPQIIADAIEKTIKRGVLNMVIQELDHRITAPFNDLASKLRNGSL